MDMGRPQQPEIARSGRTDLDPDRIGTELEARKAPPTKGRTGPIPPDNQPGQHPGDEPDKPDLDAFAARLTGAEAQPDDGDPQAATATDQEKQLTTPAQEKPAATAATAPVEGGTPRSREPAVVGLARTGLRATGRVLGALGERLASGWRRST